MSIFGPTKQTLPATAPVTIRRAIPADAGPVIALAQLDSKRVPTGDVLVAAVGRELWAAVSLDDFHTVADPFRPSGDIALNLIERARALRSPRKRSRVLRGRHIEA
ncbi:MAG: hypothetical protein QOI80_992 [Solirubrobacteraceae bacterium]|nr:hypothetical protein [Solirubrobacteraceae bacterium]